VGKDPQEVEVVLRDGMPFPSGQRLDVTIGALRATSMRSLRAAAVANKREASIFEFLTEEKDPSGFKYRIKLDLQLELFRFAIERLAKGSAVPALCKEDRTLWEQLGMKFRGCHCLLGGTDALANDDAGRLLFPTLTPRRRGGGEGRKVPSLRVGTPRSLA
jgi:hypothetical protein